MSTAWWITVVMLAAVFGGLLALVVSRELAVWRRTPQGRYMEFDRKKVGA